MRQLGTALIMYATANRGAFPTNAFSPAPLLPWYHFDLIGKYLPKEAVVPGSLTMGGGVFICPEDDGANRSYALNFWAASATSPFTNAFTQKYGFRMGMKESSSVILVTELFSHAGGGPVAYYGNIYSGYHPTATASAGQKFGAPVSPLYWRATGGRFGNTQGDLPYYRHKRSKQPGKAQDAIGRTNLCFADGHVAMFEPTDLYDPATKLSTLRAMWSPKLDRQYP